MGVLEQEIFEKFRQLDDETKLRLAQELMQEAHHAQKKLSLGEWIEKSEAFREEFRRNHGNDYRVGIQEILDEVREEATWPRD